MRRTIVTTLLMTLLWASAAPAEGRELPQPVGEVVLVISGKIHNGNAADGSARFDIPMLEALAGREGTMQTPWTAGTVTFKGPLGRALLDTVGAEGDVLKVVALDDYAVDVPVADLKDHAVILATRMNGRPMDVRDKGPLFLVYPFDQEPALYNEQYFSRSAWQVKSIVVK